MKNHIKTLLLIVTIIFSGCSKKMNIINTSTNSNRPKIHFTPEKNWINDPNGMFFYEGEYHLFYQYNPYGEKWGHMSWGHAVSKDLVTWEHLPIALEEENQVMIFSGSAVVDYNNTSGFGINNNPPIIAIYTSYDAKSGLQNQSIAYSNDKGRTFTKYQNNPVLDLKSKEFRDPKVFWYAPENKWIMTVSLSMEKKVQFYSSKDLKKWDLMSVFGPTGVTSGVWECPDLYSLEYENKTIWILGVNLGSGSIAGGSGLQYFLGDFDGKKFSENKSLSKNNLNFVEFGKDYYAGVTYVGTPNETKERKWLAWMNNWQYADKIPYLGWRGSMSIPRTIKLGKSNGYYFLKQEPIKEIKNYIKSKYSKSKVTIDEANDFITKSDLKELSFQINYTIIPSKIVNNLAFELANTNGTIISFNYNKSSRELTFTRKEDKKNVDSEDYPTVQKVNVENNTDSLDFQLFVDKNSIEIFVDNGRYVFTNLFFNTDEQINIKFNSGNNTNSTIEKLDIYNLLGIIK